MLAQQLAELVALSVFRSAGEDGRFISMAYTREHLAELKSHPPGCHCGRNCSAASVVKPETVWRVTSAWQRQVRTTKVRGLR